MLDDDKMKVINSKLNAIMVMLVDDDVVSSICTYLTLSDIFRAYWKKKIGGEIDVDELLNHMKEVKRTLSDYEMSEEEFNFYENCNYRISEASKI